MSDQNPQEKKRRAPWLLGALALIFLTFLVLLQSSNLWKNLSVENAGDTLLLYALSSLNFFAFVIFGFIFLRTLIKLIRERRAFKLGSKFKTRLWLYFFLISVLPIIAMAGFSYLFMNRAIERWFTNIPENAARESREVQNKAIELQAQKFRETAAMLAKSFENKEITNLELKNISEAGNLSYIEILSKTNKSAALFEKKENKNEPELEKIVSLAKNGRFDEPSMQDGRGFDAAIADFSDGRKLLVIANLFDEENVSQLVDNSLKEFDRLKEQQTIVRQIGFSTLGLLTFLLIFASSWMAFYIARGLTVPLNALAEGADKIAQGNLGHRVEVLAEDELALLVESFNQMSGKLAENSAELEERRRYIETVLQSLSTGVISFDDKNKVTTINKAAIQILRLEDADFTGFELSKVVTEENKIVLERLLNRAKRIGQASEQTVLQTENLDGNISSNENLPVALTARSLPRSFGETSGVVLVIEDLSELISAQRASAWAEVARRMAHEIKNPLTPIQLSAERIAKRFDAATQRNGDAENLSEPHDLAGNSNDQRSKIKDQTEKIIKEGTQTILREVSSLKAMVDEFSRFARLPNVKLESGNLNEIIKQSAALYEDRNALIELNLAESLPATMIDEEQLKRVFVNLIENAIEAFDETQIGKKITLKTFYDKARDLIVAEVSDNGNGITPSDFQKLFQPYFSTKGRGTGLGLAIVQRIISEHHGKIKAVNNFPKGAKFIVELPVVV